MLEPQRVADLARYDPDEIERAAVHGNRHLLPLGNPPLLPQDAQAAAQRELGLDERCPYRRFRFTPSSFIFTHRVDLGELEHGRPLMPLPAEAKSPGGGKH